MTERVSRRELSLMMGGAASRIREHHARLSQLDSVAGDGDHGSAMLRTMDRLERAFATESPADLRLSFTEAGWSVMDADGGASTSLIGAFFLGIGEGTAEGTSSWNCLEMAAALQSGLEALQAQTKARPGDKTIMDALAPAVEAFAEASRVGQGIVSALAAAAQSAKAGAEATRNMIARYGRARLLGEKTLGHEDPGAVSIALIFDGFYQAMNEQA